uniref:Putative N6-adenosine-methyltransferase with ZZ-type zinc-binding domains n=1 Tax=Paramecium tetraurelia TaxID=5888 RepID=Q3SE40_PARTE|nr:Putative N6-adenosine-methyltransferase with ZZ-type zinc-binding domains [Paramecium tetraurelia]
MTDQEKIYDAKLTSDFKKNVQKQKTGLKQINLDNLVYNKRERKQTGTQPTQPIPVVQQHKITHLKQDRKKKNAELQTPPREEQQQNQEPTLLKQLPISCEQLVLPSDHSSEFNPKIKPKKSKKFRRPHKHIDLEDSSDEAQYKSKLILKRVNKIFKKSYEQKQILSSGSEQENLVKELFRNIYVKIFEDIPVTAAELKQFAQPENSTGQEGEGKLLEDEQKLEEEPLRILTEDGTDFETKRNLKLLGIENQKILSKLGEIKSYINCDIRYFNIDFLVEKVGGFDVVLMDPPWRIKGGQQNDSSFMFTNSKFSLDYNTMSNQEIMDIKIEKLSKKGFLFLWILNTQLNIAFEMASKWGYEIVDQIMWVKLNPQGNNVYLSTGYYFMHSFEICLVGYKCPPGEHVEYHSKISNNVIFSSIRNKSQKPIELYEIIEMMMPGSKKVEIFARNHNLRPGWFSIGNQLGETFQKWLVQISCNICGISLQPGICRYKSKKIANFDICQNCYNKKISEGELTQTDMFFLANKADEEVLHQYHQCNGCDQNPIWGARFECITCDNYDFCEACFDNLLITGDPNHKDHEFKVIELPTFAEGIPCHDSKCNGCFQKPILGVQFICKQCTNFSLCQNCFFTRSQTELNGPRHKADHRFEPIYEVQQFQKKTYKCQGCEIEKSGSVYKCENCFGFYFCEECYTLKKDDWKCYVATSHKNYHTFIQI